MIFVLLFFFPAVSMDVISKDPIEECHLGDLLAAIDTALAVSDLLASYQLENSVNDEDLQDLVGDITIKGVAQRVITFKGRRCVIQSVYEELLSEQSEDVLPTADEKEVV